MTRDLYGSGEPWTKIFGLASMFVVCWGLDCIVVECKDRKFILHWRFIRDLGQWFSVGFEDRFLSLTGTVPIAPCKTSLQDLDLKDFRAWHTKCLFLGPWHHTPVDHVFLTKAHLPDSGPTLVKTHRNPPELLSSHRAPYKPPTHNQSRDP